MIIIFRSERWTGVPTGSELPAYVVLAVHGPTALVRSRATHEARLLVVFLHDRMQRSVSRLILIPIPDDREHTNSKDGYLYPDSIILGNAQDITVYIQNEY